MLDKRIEYTIHQIQGQLTIATNKTWSESKILNLLLYISICHPNEIDLHELREPILNFVKGKKLEIDNSMIMKFVEIINNDKF